MVSARVPSHFKRSITQTNKNNSFPSVYISQKRLPDNNEAACVIYRIKRKRCETIGEKLAVWTKIRVCIEESVTGNKKIV